MLHLFGSGYAGLGQRNRQELHPLKAPGLSWRTEECGKISVRSMMVVRNQLFGGQQRAKGALS
jgi:hypothetical protein